MATKDSLKIKCGLIEASANGRGGLLTLIVLVILAMAAKYIGVMPELPFP